jgi:hypothetical protein
LFTLNLEGPRPAGASCRHRNRKANGHASLRQIGIQHRRQVILA